MPQFDAKARFITITIITLVTAAMASLLGLNQLQIIAVTIFCFEIYATLLFWKYRLNFAFLGMSMLLAFGVIDIPHLIEFASFDVILFLISMMIVIGFLEERGFFEDLLSKIIGTVGKGANRLAVAIMLIAALFAALVDEVTSILFTTTVILHLTNKYKVKPIPFILMAVFATNIGSSATVIGNPVGVMIAFRGGLTFTDFLRWATPISVLALALTIWLSLKIFSSDIKGLDASLKESMEDELIEVRPKKNLWVSGIIFLGTVVFLSLHHPLEELLHLEKNTLLIGTAMAAASVALFIDLEKGREIIERRVDWRTLIFFTLLFASVGTLKYVGITDLLAEAIFSISGKSNVILLLTLTLVAALLSAFLDNVLTVAMFLPVVSSLGAEGAHVFPLWWAMLFAGTFFGNLTLIGSTANIVAVGMLERERGTHISFFEWIRAGVFISIPTLALAILLLYLQMPLMPI